MYRGAMLLAATMLLTIVAPKPVAAQSVDGTWKLTYGTATSSQQSLAIVTLKMDNSKLTSEMVASPYKLNSADLKGDTLRMVFGAGALKLEVEAIVPKDAGKRIAGSFIVNSGAAMPCWLELTEETKLPVGLRAIECKPMTDARVLENKVASLRQRAKLLKDPEQKKELLKEADEAAEAAKTELPKLYKEVLADFGDSPVVFEAVLKLLRTAQASGATLADVKGWAATGTKAAKPYGAPWQSEYTLQVAAALADQDKYAAVALDYAKQLEGSLTAKSPPDKQIRILSLVSRALAKSGKADEAKAIDARVEKIEVILDKEYLTTMPPFKGETFAGRKSKSERAVFMELFTGATCPPCVAADLAFDVLQKSYKPSELVLIQYHMHIPGPDPLTNADTEARWKYYGKLGGVPASVFNGKPQAGGGGGIANAESKYGAYRDVIDPLLENDASVKLSAKVVRKGDQIDISVEVTGLTDPNPEKKLRILLAEESVRYVGSNKIRFHHNVVRAFPGGVEGHALPDGNAKVKASINVGDLRGQLTKYLDESGKVFANPARPLALEHLRVIAFVQDDSTKEILQAVQVEVK